MLCFPKIKMPQLLGYLGFFCSVHNFLSCFLVLNSFLSRQTASAKAGRTNDGLWAGKGIGNLQKGKACVNVSGAKDPGLYCSECLCGMAMCVKKPFANKRFG